MTADTYSLRVTVDAALEKEIEELKALLSHKIPNGDLTAVVREAVQCALEKHRKRRGAAEPARKKKSPVAAKATETVCSGPRRRPERVKMLLLEEVKVAALRCERVRSFAASA
ncbi:MAG TPA: hypothetical protein VF400_09745, partial [Anaeromyxobacteraceae bacterium]